MKTEESEAWNAKTKTIRENSIYSLVFYGSNPACMKLSSRVYKMIHVYFLQGDIARYIDYLAEYSVCTIHEITNLCDIFFQNNHE